MIFHSGRYTIMPYLKAGFLPNTSRRGRTRYIHRYHKNSTNRDGSLNPMTVVVDTITEEVTYTVLLVPKKGTPRDISLTPINLVVDTIGERVTYMVLYQYLRKVHIGKSVSIP